MKYGAILAVFLFAIMSISVYMNEPINSGTEHEFFVNVANADSKSYDKVKTTAFIMDADEALFTRNSEIPRHDNRLFRFFWDVPEGLPAGEYVTKIVVTSDDNPSFRKSKYVFLNVY